MLSPEFEIVLLLWQNQKKVLEIRLRTAKMTNFYLRETLRGKCPYSEFFWSVFYSIRTEYGEIPRISPYSVRQRENTDQKNSKYGHFLYSERYMNCNFFEEHHEATFRLFYDVIYCL